MKTLTIQILLDTGWYDAAELTLAELSRGIHGDSTLGYEQHYAFEWGEHDGMHACSVNLPVEFFGVYNTSDGFRFLDDIMPAGSARRYWMRHLGIEALPIVEQNLMLLEKGTIAPVGNMRIKESVPDVGGDVALQTRRFTVNDVIERHTDFLDYAQAMGAISGGATGAGGEAPKLLIRCSKDDEIWIDALQNNPNIADQYYLVKFPRGQRSDIDCDILRAEYHFYCELTELGENTISTSGMKLIEGARYPSLWLPRFDVHWSGDRWHRYGLESVYSMVGAAAGQYLNHFDVLQKLCEKLSNQHQSNGFDQSLFVCEWVKRDLLNIAFGNSDNHGRNTTFIKKPDGISLAPIYDFAPMKADPESISRSTVWGSPYEIGGEYQWDLICENLSELCDSNKILSELKTTALRLKGLKNRLADRGVPNSILNMNNMAFDYLDQKLERWGLL